VILPISVFSKCFQKIPASFGSLPEIFLTAEEARGERVKEATEDQTLSNTKVC